MESAMAEKTTSKGTRKMGRLAFAIPRYPQRMAGEGAVALTFIVLHLHCKESILNFGNPLQRGAFWFYIGRDDSPPLQKN